MTKFEIAHKKLASFEGGYSKHPADKGGETYAGISRVYFPNWAGWLIIDEAKKNHVFNNGATAFTKHLASIADLKSLTIDFYKENFWDKLGLSNFNQELGNEIYEQIVNLGMGGFGRYLQRLCNAYNFDKKKKDKLFENLVEDGKVGQKTLQALATVLKIRASDADFIHALNCIQGAHYIALAAKNESQRAFIDGWLNRTKQETL